MSTYIHQLKGWPKFYWKHDELFNLLAETRQMQGRLLGKLEVVGFDLRQSANFETLIQDVLKTSEIEGEILNLEQVRSSVATRLGLEHQSAQHNDRHIDGVVDMMLDSTQTDDKRLGSERLFGWHGALFPTGWSGMHKIEVGRWRTGAMHVVSGSMGRERIHFEAPRPERLDHEMERFISWFNEDTRIDPIIKAGIAHLWFVTIHPFDDGNGRIARAITDMQLSKSDGVNQRFYSMSSQISSNKKSYYQILESTQKGDLDITGWLIWFLECLRDSINASDSVISQIVRKHQFLAENSGGITNQRQRKVIERMMNGFEGKLTSSKYAKLAKTSADTALRDINALVEKGVLKKSESGGRSTSYELNLKN